MTAFHGDAHVLPGLSFLGHDEGEVVSRRAEGQLSGLTASDKWDR